MAQEHDIDNARQVKPKARPSIHTAILAWFSERPRGKVLDAPAGFGHLSMKLSEMGFDVTCGEIDPEIFAAPGLEAVYTDLNRRIDVADGAFDYVACVDGLEHMTDPYTAVAEFARVLKDGGMGVFSIPNYTNIERRICFLFRGMFTKPVSTAAYESCGRNLFNFHNSPITITILEFMLRINGLEIVEIRQNAPKRRQMLWWPMVAGMRLVNCLRSAAKRRELRTDLTLDSKVILGGNNLIVIVRKDGDGDGSISNIQQGISNNQVNGDDNGDTAGGSETVTEAAG
jgi:SAM-dependent methyltransferase